MTFQEKNGCIYSYYNKDHLTKPKQNNKTNKTKHYTKQKNKTEQVRPNHPTNKPQNDTKNKKTTPLSRIAVFW